MKCRPFYLPREFIVAAVYIPPEAKASAAIDQLSTIITKHENANSGAVFIVTGDFNHCNLKKGLPKYYQHVDCKTRQDRTLDHCYTTIKGAYKSLKRAPLGNSDHNMVHLVPAYRQQLKSNKPVKRLVPRWTDEGVQRLQACFDCTDWSLFVNSSADLDECTDVTMDYIKFCEEMCIPKKSVGGIDLPNLFFNAWYVFFAQWNYLNGTVFRNCLFFILRRLFTNCL